MRQLSITITEEQQQYIRDNYKTMTRKEMAKNLGITIGILDGNIAIIPGVEIRGKEEAKVVEGNFNVNEYGNWILGFGRSRHY